jgi:hypothetical protein
MQKLDVYAGTASRIALLQSTSTAFVTYPARITLRCSIVAQCYRGAMPSEALLGCATMSIYVRPRPS